MELLLPSQTQSLWPRASPWARVQDSYTLQKKKIETGLSTDMKIISVDQLHWWGAILPQKAELSGFEPQLEPLVKTVAVTALFSDSKKHKYTCTSTKNINRQIQTL